MKALLDVPMMCRNFKWYEPEHLTFTIRLTGKSSSDKVLLEVIEDVQKALSKMLMAGIHWNAGMKFFVVGTV